MSENIDSFSNLPASSYLLASPGGERILVVRHGPRILVRGEECSDVERIGAAFVEWAQSLELVADTSSADGK